MPARRTTRLPTTTGSYVNRRHLRRELGTESVYRSGITSATATANPSSTQQGERIAREVISRAYEPWALARNGDILASYRDPDTGVHRATRLRMTVVP